MNESDMAVSSFLKNILLLLKDYHNWYVYSKYQNPDNLSNAAADERGKATFFGFLITLSANLQVKTIVLIQSSMGTNAIEIYLKIRFLCRGSHLNICGHYK